MEFKDHLFQHQRCYYLPIILVPTRHGENNAMLIGFETKF